MFSIKVITEEPIQAHRVITDADILKGTCISGSQIASVSSGSLLEIQILSSARVQPQLIQGIRRRDGIGEGQETTA